MNEWWQLIRKVALNDSVYWLESSTRWVSKWARVTVLSVSPWLLVKASVMESFTWSQVWLHMLTTLHELDHMWVVLNVKFLCYCPSVSEQHEVLKLVVDSMSEQKAVPFTSMSHSRLVSFFIGGKSIKDFTDCLSKNISFYEIALTRIFFFCFSFSPFRDNRVQPSPSVHTVCGLLAKCESQWKACCFWDRVQGGWFCEHQ